MTTKLFVCSRLSAWYDIRSPLFSLSSEPRSAGWDMSWIQGCMFLNGCRDGDGCDSGAAVWLTNNQQSLLLVVHFNQESGVPQLPGYRYGRLVFNVASSQGRKQIITETWWMIYDVSLRIEESVDRGKYAYISGAASYALTSSSKLTARLSTTSSWFKMRHQINANICKPHSSYIVHFSSLIQVICNEIKAASPRMGLLGALNPPSTMCLILVPILICIGCSHEEIFYTHMFMNELVVIDSWSWISNPILPHVSRNSIALPK